MAQALRRLALQQYQSTGTAGAVQDASPHQLIRMLLGGALDRIAGARGNLAAGDQAGKLRCLGGAIDIVEHLRLCLDPKAGGTIAGNLGELYDYMLRRLVQANADNDERPLIEVADLLRTLKEAWDAMPASAVRH